MSKRKRKRRPDRKWRHRRVLKSTFLSDARKRLENDVGPYFKMIEAVHKRTGRGIGFWALARMIFPVVEAVSTVMYRRASAGSSSSATVRPKERQPVRLLRELGFEYPNLVWEMYRHTLMHNDEMACAIYKARGIAWGIKVGSGHSWKQGHLYIDAAKLYQDLVDFLAREADRSKSVSVWVKESFRFNTAYNRATRDEALRLGKPVA